MITQNPFGELDDTMKGMSDARIRKIYGMNPEIFYNLPYEIQNTLMQNYWKVMRDYVKATKNEPVERMSIIEKTDNSEKRTAVRQYKLENKVKVKVLSIFKKKK